MNHSENPDQDVSYWERRVDTALFYVLVGLVALIPLLLRAISFHRTSPTITGSIVLDTGRTTDVVQYRFGLFLICAAFAFLAVLYKVWILRQQLPAHPIHLPILIFAFCVGISQLLSPFPTVAYAGFHDLRQGTLTYLACVILLFAAAHIQLRSEQTAWFVFALVPYTVVDTVLCTLDFYGFDTLRVPAVMSFIYPEKLGIRVPDHLKLSTVLANRDYSSGFGAVCSVVFLTCALTDKNIRRRILFLFLALGGFTIVLTSLAASGFVTLVCVAPMIIWVAWKYGDGKATVRIGTAAVLGFLLLHQILQRHNAGIWDETFGFWHSLRPGPRHQEVVSDDRLISAPKTQPDGAFRLPEISEPGQSAASGRVYIWKRALALIRQCPISGFGLDTFAYALPQTERGRILEFGGDNAIITKPHNLYVHLAYGSGIPALLAFLATMLVIAWRCLRTVWAGMKVQPFLAAMMIGWFAYLIQALVNDPTIETAPVFWILSGVLAGAFNSDKLSTCSKTG
ncbi:MAG: O-antigen ligase family protein [Verrucomicrobia bacterium]|nr:O-antigen ligase family protein [Verrucomicrobiota bacterium]